MAPPRRGVPALSILMCVIVGGVCFYLGNIVGMSSGVAHGSMRMMGDLEDLKADRDRLNRGM